MLSYHSADPTVDSALLVRSLEQERYIEWETEPVPADLESEQVTFVWLHGMAAGTDPRKFELFIDGRRRLEFATPRDARNQDWTVAGTDGASLRFRTTLVDRYSDLFGYAMLTLPASEVTPGKPLRLRVRGESAGSRTWYMTCRGTVEAGVKVSGVSAITKGVRTLFRPVIVDLVHLGEPLDVTLVTSAGERLEQRVVFGSNRIELQHPVSEESEEVRVSVSVGEAELYAGKALLQPVRRLTIHMVQHTHTDIGYTRPQTEILPEHLRYIDLALDFCDLTDDWPDDARFRWTCESSWAVQEYLETRPARQIERLRQRVADGRIEVTGMFLNMSEVTDEAGYQAFLWPVRRLQEAGLRVTTAMQNDVNGAAWCLADAFEDIGIRYLTMGQHGHRALIPFDRPTPFWWESPAGKRVLAFRADHYMTGNRWAIHGGHLETVEEELFRYLQQLETRQYPFARVAVQYSGTFTDNSPPSMAGCEMIRQWNEKYEWPRLRSSIAREYLEFVEQEHADQIPVHRVAWPDWWTDGFGSAPRELAAVRATQAELIATEGLLALERLLGAESPRQVERRLEEIREALIFYGEHTFGAAESITDPLCENSRVQWAEKAAYVWEAVKDAALLREAALGCLPPLVERSQGPVIALVNTLNWDRSGLVKLYIDHELFPRDGSHRIVDSGGRVVPAQPLSSRTDGTYWALQVPEVPAMGLATLRIEPVSAKRPAPAESPDPESVELENEHYSILFDRKSGAIARLFDRALGVDLVDAEAEWQLGQVIHETLGNRHQLEAFRLDDYQRTAATCVRMRRLEPNAIWQSMLIELESPAADPPSGLRCEVRLYHHEPRIELRYTIQKRRQFDPEALYVSFPFHMDGAEVCYETLGGVARPTVDLLPGTASDWQTVQNFAAVRSSTSQVVLTSDQIPLMQFGAINLGRFEETLRINRPHMFSWVMNNYWTTNFKASVEGEFSWSYTLTSSADGSNCFAGRFGLGARVPILARLFPRGGEAESGFSGSVIRIDEPGLQLVSARPESSGDGVILHLREVSGLPCAPRIEFSQRARLMTALQQVSICEQELGGPSERLTWSPFESKFVRLRPKE